MSLFGIDDIPPAPAFIRKTSGSGNMYWQEIGDEFQYPECHPHDVAWIISILHGIATKSLGQVFEPPAFKLGIQQIKALCDKYTRFYVNELDRTGDFQLARRAANTRLTNAAINFGRR